MHTLTSNPNSEQLSTAVALTKEFITRMDKNGLKAEGIRIVGRTLACCSCQDRDEIFSVAEKIIYFMYNKKRPA